MAWIMGRSSALSAFGRFSVIRPTRPCRRARTVVGWCTVRRSCWSSMCVAAVSPRRTSQVSAGPAAVRESGRAARLGSRGGDVAAVTRRRSTKRADLPGQRHGRRRFAHLDQRLLAHRERFVLDRVGRVAHGHARRARRRRPGRTRARSSVEITGLRDQEQQLVGDDVQHARTPRWRTPPRPAPYTARMPCRCAMRRRRRASAAAATFASSTARIGSARDAAEQVSDAGRDQDRDDRRFPHALGEHLRLVVVDVPRLLRILLRGVARACDSAGLTRSFIKLCTWSRSCAICSLASCADWLRLSDIAMVSHSLRWADRCNAVHSRGLPRNGPLFQRLRTPLRRRTGPA